ncbi:GDSL Lipase/Acylhydrolase family protein [Terfezia claveryi]|nr:GDSL Lipase/Acylhydrolase family protein [Terfezia claveryi]
MANAGPSSFVDYDKFLLFGDSITQGAFDQSSGFGFAAALQHDYVRKLDVINRGFSGYNTSHALRILPSIIQPPTHSQIKLMTVFFGANDAVIEGLPQHVSLEEYRTNLHRIVTHEVLQRHNPKLILITPPPICEYKTHEHDRENGRTQKQRKAARTKEYVDVALEVGRDTKIPTVNLWNVFMEYAGWSEGEPLLGCKTQPKNERLGMLLRDGLHFTSTGYEIMYNEVIEAITQHYPELKANALPSIFPAWEVAPKYESSK